MTARPEPADQPARGGPDTPDPEPAGPAGPDGAAERPGGDEAASGEVVPAEEVGELVQRLTETEGDSTATRGRLIARLAKALATSARGAGARSLAGGRWLTEVFANEVAPRLQIRDLETLRRHHKGLSGEELADALVRNAANGTTAVGAAGGALAAVQFTAPPLLLTAPAQIVAETLVVAAIEVKLVGELNEVYGVRPQGGPLERTGRHLMSWAHRRGIDPSQPGSLSVALGAAAKTALRNRLLRVLGRHLTTLGPYLTGAIAGGSLNRAATTGLGKAVRTDLRRIAIAPPAPVPAPRELPRGPAAIEDGGAR
ncbi:hypothetical protein [Allonocardiopsis opalescens]|uniref:EcsC family protein n=1 Tax=Allonocardiopsis opalescens TaxID=1144618 RepID=A0A2T0PU64_9ACTN|nr:hypothetical protein [Allonocardiopsis opalescens]PRX92434.1 hypothetical protein CLV72_110194 [Allonocardiopsis opalescens]